MAKAASGGGDGGAFVALPSAPKLVLSDVVEGNPAVTAPGRTREAPLPSGDAVRVLSAGTYD